MHGPWGEWTWLVAIAIKLVVVLGFFIAVRLLAFSLWKLMPDCRLKRALFATHGNVRRAWRAYPAEVGSDRPYRSPPLLGRQSSDQ